MTRHPTGHLYHQIQFGLLLLPLKDRMTIYCLKMYVKEWRFNESEEMDDTNDDERGRESICAKIFGMTAKRCDSPFMRVRSKQMMIESQFLLLLGFRSNNNSTNFRDGLFSLPLFSPKWTQWSSSSWSCCDQVCAIDSCKKKTGSQFVSPFPSSQIQSLFSCVLDPLFHPFLLFILLLFLLSLTSIPLSLASWNESTTSTTTGASWKESN